MHIEDIRLMFEYSYWSTYRLLDTCSLVSPGQYAAVNPAAPESRSLRQTMLHTLSGEHNWRLICQGVQVHDWEVYPEAEFQSAGNLRALWQAEESRMRTYLDGLSQAELNGTIRYPLESGTIRERPLWHCLYHVLNHGTQHRSEAAALLTGFGQEPGDFDFTLFLNQHFQLPE